MSTIRLYYDNSYLTEFDAVITAVIPRPDNQYAVILDQTAFYPESGGQPSDRGSINNLPVLDVQEEGNEILHILPEKPVTDKAHCVIDWERRFDHMQQHSGQHLLSAAAYLVTGAETVGFHLGAHSSQIDLTLDQLTREQAEAIELTVSEVIFQNRNVLTQYATPKTLDRFPVRKQPPAGVSDIRLIHVPDLDRCPCGGTHVRQTGEIGLVKIRSWERKKGQVRVDFVCGKRALQYYQLITTAINELSSRFSAPVPELLGAAEAHFGRYGQLEKECQELKQNLTDYLARELYEQAQVYNGVRVICYLLPSAQPQEVSNLAKCLASQEQTIALVGGMNPDQNKCHLVFASSSSLTVPMGTTLKSILPLVQGKGGGSAQLAQGGGAATIEQTKAALATAKAEVIRLL